MKFSFDWLKTWVDTELNATQLAHLLTMSGLEVEGVNKVAPEFSKVIVAQIVSVTKHPNADRLNVTQVNVGANELLQIVCGAPNVKPGIKIPCALPGAVLPENFKINVTKMRGLESNGMLCSAKELGLPEINDGLLLLPDDAPIGEDIRNYLNLDDDILEIKITPNRADCLSIKGIAREVIALTNGIEKTICIPQCEIQDPTTFPISIQAPNACGKLITRTIKNIQSDIVTPLWIKQRLERSDIRSINFLVDIGNYVMLELGQPLHIFDLDKLSNSIQVRFANNGEKLTCLNGKQVILEENTLIIADENSPLSIAGLMGGEYSAVSENTQNILIESAFFYPEVIAGKAKQYGFTSESSFRFERGVDYELQQNAIERATELILSEAGGQAGPLNIALGNLPENKEILVRQSRAEKLLGIPLDHEKIKLGLTQLGLQPKPQTDGFTVTSPSFRFDINIEVDLIEEIARLYGYDNIKTRATCGKLLMLKSNHNSDKEQILKKISHLGYQEVINYSFVDQEWEMDFANNQDPIKVINPIASQMNVMRSTLIGSLVHNLIANLNRKQSRVRLFEIAKTYKKNNSEFIQQEYIAALAYGFSLPEQWGVLSKKVDFFDIKNDLQQILGQNKVEFVLNHHNACLHPVKSANIVCAGKTIGVIGELHPRLVQKYELPNTPVVFEIQYNTVSNQEKVKYQPTSKYPIVLRDLAFMVPNDITAQELLSALNKNKINALQSIKIFDVYTGTGIPDKYKSIAVKLVFQASEKTLQEQEIEQYLHTLIEQVKPLGINLR